MKTLWIILLLLPMIAIGCIIATPQHLLTLLALFVALGTLTFVINKVEGLF